MAENIKRLADHSYAPFPFSILDLDFLHETTTPIDVPSSCHPFIAIMLTRHQKYTQLERNVPSAATLGREVQHLISSGRVNRSNVRPASWFLALALINPCGQVRILETRTNDAMKAWREFGRQVRNNWGGTNDEVETMNSINAKMNNLRTVQYSVVNLWASLGVTVTFR